MEAIHLIKAIPGPTFLLVFSAFALAAIFIGRMIVRADGSSASTLPEHAGLDAISIAMLDGGIDSVIRTSMLSLLKRKLVVIEGTGKDMRVKADSTVRRGAVGSVEAEIIGFLSKPRAPKDFFSDAKFRASLEAALAPADDRLRGLNLLKSDDERNKAILTGLAVAAVIVALGGIKLFLGITRNKPVAFLVVLLIVAVVLVFVLLRPFRRQTALGVRYIDILKDRFKWAVKRTTLPDNVDPVLLAAIYGAGILPVAAFSPFYKEAFGSRKTGGCGGGCSGGCSGGGGGCGGGCGGCGGD